MSYSQISLKFDFSGLRIIDSTITPVNWKVSVDIESVVPDKGPDSSKKALLAYQKIQFWLSTALTNSAFIDINNTQDIYIVNLINNNHVYCPGVPNDGLIAKLLFSKISVLSDNILTVLAIRIYSDDTSAEYIYESDDVEYQLCIKTTDYYNNKHTRTDKPWWLRNDGFTFEPLEYDLNETDPDSITKHITDPLDEFKKLADVVLQGEPAKVIQVKKWKPKRIK